jgi:hypothetical protein
MATNMTWVIGASTVFGYGIVISDIRVTNEATGQRWDVLQKAFPVGKFIVGGFTGNVSVGLKLLDSLKHFLKDTQPEQDECWEPEWVADEWCHQARNIFASEENRNPNVGDTHILTVGISPDESTFGNGKVCVTAFRSPSFDPETVVGGNRAISVGSGSQVERYRESLEYLISDPNLIYMQGEIGNTGGFAGVVANMIHRDVTLHPVESVSPHAHFFVIRLGQIQEQRTEGMPNVATNWNELLQELTPTGQTDTSALVADATRSR